MSAQTEVNERLWRRDLVAHYDDRRLRPPEVMQLLRHHDELNGSVFELGCGGGRLSGYLVRLAERLHAIDISPQMVAHCRRRYPAGRFEVGDARDLSALEDGAYDAVVASFAVLDVLDDAARRRALRDLARALRPGGLLLMSTHNLAYAPRIPEQLRIRSRRAPGIAREAIKWPVRKRNHLRMAPLQQHGDGWAVLSDEGHDFALLNYYVSRDYQQRQFAEAGLEPLEVLDLDGDELTPGDEAPTTPELHYAARRPAA
jgi:SAM-dependent methyltransferase